MKGLKDFRRSLNKDRTSRGAAPTTYTGVRSATAATKQPPSKVIRATRDYRAHQPNELSFAKGDFFHVLNDSTHPDWFEAVNPITNARGHVPAAYFDVLTKTARPGLQSIPGPQSPPLGGPMGAGGPGGMPGPDGAGFGPVGSMGGPLGGIGGGPGGPGGAQGGAGGLYAVVKYDFDAERPDELQSKAGDSIIVIAQSNFEWFVARPIGKLGGPGLIPVAFVEIRDMVTGRAVENVHELIQNGFIPKVEEWKKMKADYSKNTIPLGRFDFAQGGGGPSQQPGGMPFNGGMGGGGMMPPPGAYGGQFPPHGGPPGAGGPISLGAGPPLHGADIYQRQEQPLPEPPQEEIELPPGMAPGEPLPCGLIESARVDSFHYEQGDYWFRIQATHIAGPSPGAPDDVVRAPTGEVRELILYRLYEDFYEFQLALLEHFPAEAGRESGPDGRPSERILPLMPGPIEEVDDVITSQRRADLDTYIQELCALPEHIRRSELLRVFFESRPGDHCTRLPLQPGQGASGGSSGVGGAGEGPGGVAGHGDEGPTPTQTDAAGEPVLSNGTHKYSEDQPVNPSARVGDNLADSVASLSLGGSSKTAATTDGESSVGGSGADARSSAGTGGTSFGHLQPLSMLTKTDTAGSGGSARGISPSAAGAAGGGGFIKIKIFNRASDDLVAIRVPPDVSFAGLMGKVRERLGNEIAVMRYRDEGGMMRLSDDDDLSEWIASGQKLTLWADVR